MLKLESVDVAYGHVQALTGVSIEVRDGELVTLLGANGAGKSTTLMTISGIVRPRAGALSYDGVDLAKASPFDIVQPRRDPVPGGAQDLRRALRAGEPAHGRRAARGRGGVRADMDWVFSLFPVLAADAAPVRRHAERRGAADARHRPGADGPAPPAHAGRAVPGAGAARGAGDLPGHPRAAPPRGHDPAGGAERAPGAGGGRSRLRAGHRQGRPGRDGRGAARQPRDRAGLPQHGAGGAPPEAPA